MLTGSTVGTPLMCHASARPGAIRRPGHRPSGAVMSRWAQRHRGARRVTSGRVWEGPTVAGPYGRRRPGPGGGAAGRRRLDRRTWRAPPSTARRRTAARGLGWSTSSARPRWRRRRARRSEGRGQVEEGSGVACVHAVRGVPALRRSPLAPSGSCGKPEPTRTCGGDLPVERDQRCPSDRGPRHVSGPACRGARRTWRERGAAGVKGAGSKRCRAGQAGTVIDPAPRKGPDPGSKECRPDRAGTVIDPAT